MQVGCRWDGAVASSFRALSGRLKFTVRRHKLNIDILPCCWGAEGHAYPDGVLISPHVHRRLPRVCVYEQLLHRHLQRRNRAGLVLGVVTPGFVCRVVTPGFVCRGSMDRGFCVSIASWRGSCSQKCAAVPRRARI